MMEDAAVFSVLSKCFGAVDEGEWNCLTESRAWSAFLDGVRRLLQGDAFTCGESAPVRRMHERCPLQDFLSSGEVDALYRPLTFAEKASFAARHFTGGLPESAVPVESLYTAWQLPHETNELFGRAQNLYGGSSARYMEALCASLGLRIPKQFADSADHLALELDLVAVLLRSGMTAQAREFLAERFEWLTAYRMRLLELAALDPDARFYIGLIDVLLGMRAAQEVASVPA